MNSTAWWKGFRCFLDWIYVKGHRWTWKTCYWHGPVGWLHSHFVHADHHTDVLDVAREATEANASRLVLTHIGFPTPNKLIEDFFVQGMDAFYSGQIILGSDGMDIELLP